MNWKQNNNRTQLEGNKIKEQKGMKLTTNIKDKLQYYINNNEAVYQFCGEVVKISNETAQKNKKELLGYFKRANLILVYDKHSNFVKCAWSELTDKATDDDVLFLLDGVGVLKCISQKDALANNLIVA